MPEIEKIIKEFEERGIIIRAREKSQSKFQPVLYWDNEIQEDLLNIKSFLLSSLQTAYAEGQREMLRKVREKMPDVREMPPIEEPSDYAQGVHQGWNSCCYHTIQEIMKLDLLLKNDNEKGN